MMLSRLICVFLLVVGLRSPITSAAEPVPLSNRIDQLILEKAAGQPLAERTNDAEFLRRVWLDLAGRIPSSTVVREFLADTSPDKRTVMIDRLLASPDWPNRAADLFHVQFMERRGEDENWKAWLKHSFAENRPWDQMVRDMLNPNADDEVNRSAAFFLTKRLENYGQNPIDYPGLVRDVGRLFMGRDLQCAECHNHLFIDDYKQKDFQGLFVVYRNTFIRKDVKFPALGEKALAGRLEFVSVFDPTKMETGPRLPGGTEFEIPVVARPADLKKKTPEPPRPEWSAVELLAKEVTRPENRAFVRASVNRFWFTMMGRGLVHPLDLHHSGNPPSHPELLELLADEFIAHQFDVKWLIRELALTETWQRSSRLPAGLNRPPAPAAFTVALERRLSPEQLAASIRQASGPGIGAIDSGSTSATESPPTPTNPPPSEADLRTAFIEAFANDAREPEEEVASSVKGALFWRNDDRVQDLLRTRPGSLVDRLLRMQDADPAVEELFLAVLSRQPDDAERADIAAFLNASGARKEPAIRDVVWALLASVEFYVNH